MNVNYNDTTERIADETRYSVHAVNEGAKCEQKNSLEVIPCL